MESYGELLRKAREAKHITIEAAERDTTIMKNYIEAIEEEMVDVFPAEPYFIGFLKNYCEYLGVDTDGILALYHAQKIQESPLPRELLAKHRPKFLIPLIVVLSLLVLGGLGFYLYFYVFNVPELLELKRMKNLKENRVRQYTFEGRPETRRLYKGDQILFPTGEGEGNVILTVAGTLGNLSILTPGGTQIIELSEERELDINADGIPDVILYLSDVSNTEESHGAEVRILGKNFDGNANTSEEGLNELSKEGMVKGGETRTVVHESNRAYPFTLTASLRYPCLLRYKIDRQDYVENYYMIGDSISITANNGIRLWVSNINAVKLSIKAGLQSYDLEVGRAGEVKAEDIKWVRDADGKYRIVVLELD